MPVLTRESQSRVKKGLKKGSKRVILRVYEANLARLTEPKGLYWGKGVQDDYFTPI